VDYKTGSLFGFDRRFGTFYGGRRLQHIVYASITFPPAGARTRSVVTSAPRTPRARSSSPACWMAWPRDNSHRPRTRATAASATTGRSVEWPGAHQARTIRPFSSGPKAVGRPARNTRR
jgi:hypothetical protein